MKRESDAIAGAQADAGGGGGGGGKKKMDDDEQQQQEEEEEQQEQDVDDEEILEIEPLGAGNEVGQGDPWKQT